MWERIQDLGPSLGEAWGITADGSTDVKLDKPVSLLKWASRISR